MSAVRRVIASLLQMMTADEHPVKLADVQQRSILAVLQNSLKDYSEREGGENEVRYKLIIDPSEDSSVVRLLFRFGVLQRSNTRIYVCSNFPGENELHKVSRRRFRSERKADAITSSASSHSYICVFWYQP